MAKRASKPEEQFFVISKNDLEGNCCSYETEEDAEDGAKSSCEADNPYVVVKVVGVARQPAPSAVYRRTGKL